MNIFTTTFALAITCVSGTALAGPVYNLQAGEYYDGLSGITNMQLSELIGSVERDEYQGFQINGQEGIGGLLYEGTLKTRVVRSTETGNLTLNFRLYNENIDLNGQIERVEINGFNDHITRIEYRAEAGFGDFGPSSVSRSLDSDTLSFNFDEGFEDAPTSKYFFAMLDTDAYDFNETTPTATIYLYSGEAVTIDLIPGIPAPGSLALLSAAGLLATRRRR